MPHVFETNDFGQPADHVPSHVPGFEAPGRAVGSSRGDSERPGVFVRTMDSNSSKKIVGEFSVAVQKNSVVEWRRRESSAETD